MTDSRNRFVRLFRLAGAAALACVALLAVCVPAQAACTVGACVTAGPRLASVDTQKSALLNPLLGGLLGSSLSLTAADWNSLATGNVQLLGFLNALQASTNTSTPSQALAANVTLAQIAAALGVQAQAQANTSLSGALQTVLGEADTRAKLEQQGADDDGRRTLRISGTDRSRTRAACRRWRGPFRS